MDRGKDRRDMRTAVWTEVRIGLTRLQSVKSRTDTMTSGWREIRIGLTGGIQDGQVRIGLTGGLQGGQR